MHRMQTNLMWAHSHLTGVKSRAPLTSPPSLVVRQSLQVRSGGAAGQRRGGGREQVWAAAARMRRAVGDDDWQSTRCGTGAAAGSRGLSTDHREAPPEELLCERRSSGRALPLVPQPLSGAASSQRPSRAARRELPPPAPHARSGLRGKACQRLAGAAWSRTKLVFCGSVWAKLLQRARYKGLRPRSRPKNARLGGLQLKLVLEPWEKPSQRGPNLGSLEVIAAMWELGLFICLLINPFSTVASLITSAHRNYDHFLYFPGKLLVVRAGYVRVARTKSAYNNRIFVVVVKYWLLLLRLVVTYVLINNYIRHYMYAWK
jgi:hypothetical protein